MGDDCCDGCEVIIDAFTPRLSGAGCPPDGGGSRQTVDCQAYTCLSLSTDDFAIDYDSENCIATVCSLTQGLNISGHYLDGCCETQATLTSIPNARNIEFGSGIQITAYDAGEEGECCEPGKQGWVKLDVCSPKIGGRLGNDEYYNYLDGNACCPKNSYPLLECKPFDCINFDEDSFRITYDNCEATVYACRPKVSGEGCPDDYDNRVSVECTGFQCLSFNPKDFAVSVDESSCSAEICSLSNGIKISGNKGDYPCCPEDPANFVTVKDIREIELGDGITIISSSDGDSECCADADSGKIKIDVCRPEIDGVDCDGTDITPNAFERITFNSDHFAVDYDSDSCQAEVCVRAELNGLKISGYGEGDYCCETDGTLAGWENIGTLEFGSGIIVSDAQAGSSSASDCCKQLPRGNLKIDVCQQLIAGESCDGDPIDCKPFKCIEFDSDHFGLDYNNSDCSARVISKTAGFTISGSSDECCDGSFSEIPYVGSLKFGKGLRIADSSAGSESDPCNVEKGYVEIEACPPVLPASYILDGAGCDGSATNINITGISFGAGLEGYETEIGDCGSSLRMRTAASQIKSINGCTSLDPCINLNISGEGCIGSQAVRTECNSNSIDVFLNIPAFGIDASWQDDACTTSTAGGSAKISGISFGYGLQGTEGSYVDCEGDRVSTLTVELGGSVLDSVNGCSLDPCINLNIIGTHCGTDIVNTTCGTNSIDVEIDLPNMITGFVVNGCKQEPIADCDDVTLTITGEFCGHNFVETDCSSGGVSIGLTITKEMITECLDVCCIEYLDHNGDPASMSVYGPEGCADCYGTSY